MRQSHVVKRGRIIFVFLVDLFLQVPVLEQPYFSLLYLKHILDASVVNQQKKDKHENKVLNKTFFLQRYGVVYKATLLNVESHVVKRGKPRC
jgi:hypothetical protein